MSWDEFQKSIGWNNTDAVRGFQSIANNLGYSGPVQERIGQEYVQQGDSGQVAQDIWGPAAGLSKALAGYQFGQGTDASGNPITQVYNPDGSMRDSARVGSSGGSLMKAAGVVIPALTMAGFGAGAYGLLGGGGAAPAAGSGAIGSGEGAAQLAAYTAANPLTAAQVAGTIPASGLPGLAASGAGMIGGINAMPEALQSLEAYSAANPLTASQVAGATLPAAGLPGLAAAGGGLLGSALGSAGSAASWMKENPTLGKLLMSGGMGLLSSSGGGGGGAPAPTYGPAQQWSSPIQQGIQSTPQQMSPAAIQRPQGLLAQGQQNDGAWRYLKGQ